MLNGQGDNEEVQAQQAMDAMFLPVALPLRFTFTQQQMLTEDGGMAMAVLMSLTTPAGTNHYLLPPDGAATFFAEGMKIASASKAGILIPGRGGQ